MPLASCVRDREDGGNLPRDSLVCLTGKAEDEAMDWLHRFFFSSFA